MRLVLDTNTVISGLLWKGTLRRLLDAAISGTVDLYTSAVLATELRDVLAYPKFAKRLAANGDTVDGCVGRYSICLISSVFRLFALSQLQRRLCYALKRCDHPQV